MKNYNSNHFLKQFMNLDVSYLHYADLNNAYFDINVYFLYRKRRLDTKSEDAIGLEPMKTPMSERKTNVYLDDRDGRPIFMFKNSIFLI